MLAYILPTRNRPNHLSSTLRALASLPYHDAQVIIADNASSPAAAAPPHLPNGLTVSVLRLDSNHGAAARNAAVRAADRLCEWVVMLDDDSHPTDLRFLRALAEARPDTAAIAAEIHVPDQGTREAGGLPEVFIGCGAAIRRRAFLEAGGYDESFDYYAEEYDLTAELLLAGWRTTLDRRFRVDHHKAAAGRDMNRILRRLVRNNGWVAQRYAPSDLRRAELRRVVGRYGAIARREQALPGFFRGLTELAATLPRQKRRPMPVELFDRFTGLAAAREALHAAHAQSPFAHAHLAAEGKNAIHVRAALAELGVTLETDTASAIDPSWPIVIGTLSPGPMLDAHDHLRAAFPEARIIAPWPGLLDNTYVAEAPSVRRSTAA